jgi:hypothetical protein
MTTKPDYEIQLSAMRAVMEALDPLDEAAREAVFVWVGTQLGISNKLNLSGAPNGAEVQTPLVGSRPTVAREGTVNVVAQKLGTNSARDLLLAAACHLTLYQHKDSFTREELIFCAKQARAWKASYSAQMSINIRRMSDASILFEKARGVFSLSDDSLAEAKQRIER